MRMSFGDRAAMRISRIMGAWKFIVFVSIVISVVIISHNLLSGQPLDVFNLMISLYTLAVDLIILKANNTLNDGFLEVMNRILALEESHTGTEQAILSEVRMLGGQIDRICMVRRGEDGKFKKKT